MQLRSLPLLAFLGMAANSASAQSAADDLFFNAYMACQKGEKAEAKGDVSAAAKAYNQAISGLDQVIQRFPTWSPSMVKFRRERAADALAKLQSKGPAVSAGRPGIDENPLDGPPLPERDPLPPDEFPAPPETPRTSKRKGAPTGSAPSQGSGDPINEIQTRMASLKRDLDEARERLDKATKEKAEVAKQLQSAVSAAQEAAKKAEVLQSRADRAEKALIDAEKSGNKSGDELAALKAEVSKSKKQMRELQYERDAEAELREAFTSRAGATTRKAEALAADRDEAQKATKEIPKQLANMQKEIDRVSGEKGALEAKLSNVEKQLLAVTTQRDDAVKELTKFREAQKNVDKLLADNTALMAKLGEAEKQITALKADGVQKDDDIKRLNSEVTDVRKQLADTQKQSSEYQTQMTDLRKQLDLQAKELAQVKTDGTKSVADRERLAKENELLRGIVLRAQKSQADRDQRKKLVLGELAKLEVNSKALSSQIELLGSPVVKLSAREKSLFKDAVLTIGEADISFSPPKENAPTAAVASTDPAPGAEPADSQPKETPKVADAKAPEVKVAEPAVPPKSPEKPAPSTAETSPEKTTPAPLPELPPIETASTEPVLPAPAPPLPDELQPLTGPANGKPGKKGGDKLASIPKNTTQKKSAAAPLEGDLPTKEASPKADLSGPGVQTTTDPAVPAEILGQVREAKDQFERGNLREAEKTYQKALTQAPKNLHVLSNLGVVYFRSTKYKLAIETFQKAIAIAPEDDFCHCTLGIVHYAMGDLDAAIDSLTRALAINPKNATAHNYLGITASQKGWQEAAMKELETATALDPNYADAHFNLAVVHATVTPPNKESARQHYKRATELGAEPDNALEQMLK